MSATTAAMGRCGERKPRGWTLKATGSELERALGARGGCMVLGVLAGVLTLAWRVRECHYGRNGAMWGTQTARLDPQSNGE